MKNCRMCGEPEPVNAGLCRSHYNEYMRGYNLKRYHRIREESIAKLGGKCVECGGTNNLEFDHVNAETKLYAISHEISKEKLDKELVKCQLLCREHHIAKGARNGDQGQVDHGGGVSGKKNCKCPPCKAKKAEYMRKYNSTRAQ